MAFSDKELQIIQWGTQNGKTSQEIKDAVVRFRTTGSPADPKKIVKSTEPSLIEREKEVFTRRAENIKKIITGTEEYAGQDTPLQTLKRGVEATAEAFSAVPEAAIQALPEEARGFLGKIGEGYKKAVDYVGGLIGSTETAQKFVEKYPEAAQVLTDTARTLEAGGEIAGDILAVEGIKTGLPKTASAVKTVAQKGVVPVAEEVYQRATNLKNNTKNLLTNKTVNPQLKASAERLFLEGTKELENPVARYDKYLNQSKKALTDIKVDPAISVVGSEIGDAFKKVVDQKRAVGKIMGEELKNIGNVQTNILPAQDGFIKSLATEGLKYDRTNRRLLQTARQTKFTKDELGLLKKYAQDFQKLGSKPNIQQLDAFISRVGSELNLYKSKSGIVGTTNAERIIKSSLSNLREQFNPATTGNKALTNYYNARKTFADLADFVDDGVGYFGKITQSGDFAKDASLLKSSVQSILNNGKKDFLLELEALTGYRALDEAVLALQAMKDAGDFRGVSLLQILTDGALPTSKAGFTQKIVDFALEKGSRAVLGTPEEQTRAFLESLK